MPAPGRDQPSEKPRGPAGRQRSIGPRHFTILYVSTRNLPGTRRVIHIKVAPPARLGPSIGNRLESVMKQAGLLFLLLALVLTTSPLESAERITGRYALILSDPAPAERFASRHELRAAAGMSYRQQIDQAQKSVRDELSRRRIGVLSSANLLLNAVFVQASQDQEAELRSIPGVQRVVPVARLRLKLDRAVQLVNAPAAWNRLGGVGNAGAGIKIGIIDTGIEQTHPAFQDNSLAVPAGFPKCQGNDCAFTNNKVIVARSYVRQLAAGSPPNPAVDSHPDDYSPRDRVGHGTALAMIAAGETNSDRKSVV